MTGYVTDSGGNRWELPPLISWQLDYGDGVPCDSFILRCPWDNRSPTRPGSWVKFTAEHRGEVVFTGVVDECSSSLDGQGGVLEVAGRGMAARLLDNEALGQDYGTATQADILRDHVRPYGIEAAPGGRLPAVPWFSVRTGSSEWAVLYQFARYHGGVQPRFDRLGRLVLTGWQGGKKISIHQKSPVTAIRRVDRRYGVLSQVLVRDRYSGAVQRVENTAFRNQGGMARRIVTMPGRAGYQTMRRTGQFQLDCSKAERLSIEVELAGEDSAFCAFPGDLVELDCWGEQGTYRVRACRVSLDEGGYLTRLVLGEED